MVFFFIDFYVIFENIDISSELGEFIGMINGGVVLCAIFSSIDVARGPIKSKIFLLFPTSYPMEAQVRGITFLLDDGFVNDSSSC